MRVLFLDMDGVVNSAKYFNVLSKTKYRQERRTRKERMRAAQQLHGHKFGVKEKMEQLYLSMIDPETVKLLNEVVERTGCAVVSSSSWRWAWELDELTNFLAAVGFKTRILDRTPDEYKKHDPLDEHQRGYEIDAWLKKHPEVDSFAILDDQADMAHLIDRLVQTTWADGLLREHVEPLVKLLTTPVKP